MRVVFVLSLAAFFLFGFSVVIFATVGNLYFIKSASFFGRQCILHIGLIPPSLVPQHALPFRLSLNGFIEAISLCYFAFDVELSVSEWMQWTVVVVAFRPIGAARRSIALHSYLLPLMKSPYWGRCDFGVNLIRHRWHWTIFHSPHSSRRFSIAVHSASLETLGIRWYRSVRLGFY